MKFIILLAIIVFGEARNIDENGCDGVIVHNINHKKEVLKSNINSPYQLAIDYDTHTLFFSYSSQDAGETFKTAYINLKTNVFNNIPGIAGGFANAVDPRNHVVYFGGRDGLYRYNFETNTAEHIFGTNHNIWQIFYKNDLYYTKYPEEAAYLFKDGVSQRVPELQSTRAMLMAIDKNNDIYYSNSSGLFLYKRSKEHVFEMGEYNANGFTSDMDGNLYFSTPNGIYFIDDVKREVKLLANIDNVYGIAIERDGNIIYASEDSIIRLKPTKKFCYVDKKIDV